MVSIIAGLNAAPVRRLKRSWELVNARHLRQLVICEMIISPHRNFKNYRDMLATISPPCVPFVGKYFIILSGGADAQHQHITKVYSLEPYPSYMKAVKIHCPAML
jgi:hypothetical protein